MKRVRIFPHRLECEQDDCSLFVTVFYLIHKIDKMFLQTVSNHPAHILNNEGQFSPSSFIPFCSFGQDFIGIEINDFDIAVCDIFKPRNYLDQLCYETDLQDLKDSNSQKIGDQLEMGLTLLLDFNEERQSYNFIGRNMSHKIKAPYHNNDHSFSLYMDAISI